MEGKGREGKGKGKGKGEKGSRIQLGSTVGKKRSSGSVFIRAQFAAKFINVSATFIISKMLSHLLFDI